MRRRCRPCAYDAHHVCPPPLSLSLPLRAFRRAVPCFLAIELDDVDYPGYHKTTDTVSYMNYGQATDIAKGLLATMCAVAGVA